MKTRLATWLAFAASLLVVVMASLTVPATSASATVDPSASVTVDPSASATVDPSASVTVDPSASATASSAHTARPSATPEMTDTVSSLPVTGSTPWLFVLAGVLGLTSGAVLYVLARRSRVVFKS